MTTLLTKGQVTKRVGYSAVHIARLVEQQRFPKPVKPFGRLGRALWVEHEIEDWIADKILERDRSK